ncbi:helix-turn-helix domain-containing protein, partial [Escherichia coli]|uniref:helix-turn-helix domain-containing protein n=1 Tax=Escherichia coli TaxID=562 RepID=UPI0028E05F8D
EEGAAKVTRNDAVRVAKRAAAAMGLKSSKIALIDQLFAASKPADWTTAGVAPVVWPSNERLARDLGISISTMKHHLNGL